MPKDLNNKNNTSNNKTSNKSTNKIINVPNELININKPKEIKQKKEIEKIEHNKKEIEKIEHNKKVIKVPSKNKQKIIESDEESYDDPLKPKQDKLSKEEIKDLLKEYTKVNDNSELKIGTHVRYFNIDKGGELKFRMGGEIMLNNGLPDYIILVSGKIMWSVQTKNTIFYRRLSYDEIVEPYTKKIVEQEKEIKLLKDIINNMKSKK